ncbi:hypothetical protein EG329_008212 [Mollisiaceae sp. DMI_Dod_QoI]|nr:hypothetical protein EG329_008212 [Helotiales sp. DMI_Dod_QoI]
MSSTAFLRPRRIVKVKQACDCCHARKIRCDGEKLCANCLSTDLTCTYLAVPKKKGPKGKRKNNGPRPMQMPHLFTQNPPPGHTARDEPLPSLKETFELDLGNSPHPMEPIRIPSIESQPAVIEDGAIDDVSLEFQPSPLVTDDLLKACLEAFFTHKYPIMPILDRENVYAKLPSLKDLPEQYSLMTALCSVIVLQPEILDPLLASRELDHSQKSWLSCEFLIEETIRARKFCDHIERPTLATVQASFFLFAALFCLGKDNSAWFYIRESMTMLQLLRLHEESTYTDSSDLQYSTYCRRTFWLLFITERAYALQRHRPLTSQRTINLPTVDLGPEASILSGFLDLVSLFQNFDDTFLSLWNLSGTDSSTSTQSLVQLQDILKFAIPNVSKRTDIQQADLLVSRQWLKTMVWQLCVSTGLLSSVSTDESMSFHYPVTIARDVVLVSQLLPPKSFEANGVGILEKVFDIGCSLADVLSVRPSFMSFSVMEVGPRDYLMELLRILRTGPGGDKFLRLLASKVDDCLGVRIQGSLPESETSDRIIEEIDDGDVDYIVDCNRALDIQQREDLNASDVRYSGPGLDPNQNVNYRSLNPHESLSTVPLPNIEAELFAHPIVYTPLNRRNTEQQTLPFPISFWDHYSASDIPRQYGGIG